MVLNITKKLKIYIAVILLVLGIIGYYSARAAYSEYKFLKERANRVEFIETRLDTLESRKNKEIESISDNVNKSRKTKNKIKTKLKKDEETIDNTDVSDDDVDRLLTRFKD